MRDRRRTMPAWRVALPLAMAVLPASPGSPAAARRGTSAGGSVAVRAAVPVVTVGDAALDGADGFRDELRRDGGDFAASGSAGHGRNVELRFTGAPRRSGPAPPGAADGAVLSLMSRSLARWKGGASL